MQHIYETFWERLSESVDEADLRKAMADAAGAFDLRTFAYLSLPSDVSGTPRLISNYPSPWTTRYLNQRYEKIDPVITRARCDGCPFRWGPQFGCSDTSKAQRRLFDEASEFGICCGLTIPIADRRGGLAAMTFAADEDDHAFLRVADRYEQALQLMATCFHVELRRKRSGCRIVDGVRLTPREYQCLQWAARGKSARDIGAILDITQRTATFHLDNAKAKLGVRTRAQAIARFSAHGPFRR
ncbi:LuxR family transcriptional regulator [Nitratireductor luteus]|uniref:LuxR family transcriptional regulator n=1 Tax=Nitratireductor luteus TaxID=2976980 RepID=UPI0022408CD9|nr:LuxR family transcriptional regulator [Nitratireductor luteus]